MMYYLDKMKNIILYIINNKKFFIFFFVILLFFIVILTRKDKGSTPTPLPINNDVATYNELTPGTSSKEEVLSRMGTAIKAKLDGNMETYEYLSSNPNFNSEVIIIDNRLSYLKVVYTNKDNKYKEDFVSLYGNPENILYGPDYSVGYTLNTYPSKGIAFISHTNSFRVSEVWYFKPVLLEDFMSNYAVGYDKTPDLSR